MFNSLGAGFVLLGEGLIAVWVIDKVTGKRKKVYVKNDAERRKLLAQNRELKKKLAKKKSTKRK